jgi:tetratricopeptide (TPR) repeat protein
MISLSINDNKDPHKYRNLAYSLMMIGKTMEAIQYLVYSIQIKPISATYHHLGNCYRVLGSKISAINCF